MEEREKIELVDSDKMILAKKDNDELLDLYEQFKND